MRNSIYLLLILTTLLSCSSIRYVSDHLDKDYYAPLGKYAIEGECDRAVSKIQEIRISNAIHEFLQDQGYSRSDDPDFIFQFFVKENQQSYFTRECDYYGRWVYGEHCQSKVVSYKEGSIVIDVIDAQTQSIIWHGAAYSPPFDQINNPGEKIPKYVNKLLGDYFLGHK